MQCIRKYPLLDRETALELPAGSKILTVQWQKDKIVLWAMVEPDATPRKRRFLLVATGEPVAYVQQALAYIATMQTDDGSVFHVFEVDGAPWR